MNHMCDVPDLRTWSINLSSASACCDSKSLRIITIHIFAEASRPYTFSLPIFSRCIYDISMSREFLTRVEALGEEHCSRATQRGRRPKRIVPLFLRCILGNPRRMMPKKKWVSLLRIFFFLKKIKISRASHLSWIYILAFHTVFLLYNASNMCVGEEEEEKSHLSVGMNRRSFLTMLKTTREREKKRLLRLC